MSVKMEGDRRLCGKMAAVLPYMNVSKKAEQLNDSLVDGRSLAGSNDNSAPKTTADVIIVANSAIEGENIYKESPGTFREMDGMMSFHSPTLHTAELSKIERIGVISVLEDCIDQLYILGKTNKKMAGPIELQYRSFKERCILLYCCKCRALYSGMLAIRNISSISSPKCLQGTYG
jgi:hypothetical protein